jgi:hypothetical protein
MTEPKRDSPRRYIVNGTGQRVIVGLTISETIEFETLDNPDTRLSSATLHGRCVGQDDRERRWLELYVKHEQAWSKWMAKAGARAEEVISLN